jgi:hypothetical protein
MKYAIELALVFVLFAFLYPRIAGRKWSQDMTKGYATGMFGAAVVTLAFAVAFTIHPLF